MQSVAITMRQRAERHADRIAGISERVVSHVESMEPGEVLGAIHEVEKFDRMARKTYGLDDRSMVKGPIALNILTGPGVIVNPNDRTA